VALFTGLLCGSAEEKNAEQEFETATRSSGYPRICGRFTKLLLSLLYHTDFPTRKESYRVEIVLGWTCDAQKSIDFDAAL